jgi:hypothetical protein
MPDTPPSRFSRHITHKGPGRRPRHKKREHTMNNWTNIIDAVSGLLNLAAAVITLISTRPPRPKK